MSDMESVAEGRLGEFFHAAATGDEDEITEYIKDGGNLDTIAKYENDDDDAQTCALLLATRRGHVNCVKKLLDFGADISIIDQLYTRALIYASCKGLFDRIRVLAVAGFYKNVEIDLYAELISAARQHDLDRLDQLLLDNQSQMSASSSEVDELCFRILLGYPVNWLENKDIAVDSLCSRGFTPLIAAVLVGSVEWIDCLIERKADVNRCENVDSVIDLECNWVANELCFDEDLKYFDNLNSNEKTVLIFAVWTQNLEVIQHILSLHPNLNDYDSQIHSALIHAVYVGSPQIVEMLISRGADINHVDYKTRQSVLCHAMYPANETIARMLLEAGAEVNFQVGSRRTPFLLAAEINRANMLDLFLKMGKSDVDVREKKSNNTALMIACNHGYEECIQLLIRSGADLKTENDQGDSAIEIAAKNGRLNCVKIIMEFGGSQDKDLITHYGEKLLHSAAESDNLETLQFCLEDCQDINALNDSDDTPLMCATQMGRVENVQLLIAKGADVNCRNGEGKTVIVDALEMEDFQCFEIIMKEGADVNVTPEEHDTPLVIASGLENPAFLQLLLTKDCKQLNTVSSHMGRTPLIQAIQKEREENINILMAHNVDINRPDLNGSTPLMHSAKARLADVFMTLLCSGADPNTEDEDEVTVIWDALCWPECLELLLEDGRILNDEGKLRSVHTDCGIEWGMKWSVKCLRLLFDYDVFDWSWYVEAEQHDQMDKISFAAVLSGNGPYSFTGTKQQVTSLLQESFLAANPHTIRFLLTNLYFTIEDYRIICFNRNFQERVRDSEDFNPETECLLESVMSQPWRLETMCLLSVSSSLISSTQPDGLKRSQRVDSLPIPEIFKERLKFQSPAHNLCIKHWPTLIGKKVEELTDSNYAGLPKNGDLEMCDENCDLCEGFGIMF